MEVRGISTNTTSFFSHLFFHYNDPVRGNSPPCGGSISMLRLYNKMTVSLEETHRVACQGYFQPLREKLRRCMGHHNKVAHYCTLGLLPAGQGLC